MSQKLKKNFNPCFSTFFCRATLYTARLLYVAVFIRTFVYCVKTAKHILDDFFTF